MLTTREHNGSQKQLAQYLVNHLRGKHFQIMQQLAQIESLPEVDKQINEQSSIHMLYRAERHRPKSFSAKTHTMVSALENASTAHTLCQWIQQKTPCQCRKALILCWTCKQGRRMAQCRWEGIGGLSSVSSTAFIAPHPSSGSSRVSSSQSSASSLLLLFLLHSTGSVLGNLRLEPFSQFGLSFCHPLVALHLPFYPLACP